MENERTCGNFCPVNKALVFINKKWSIELIRDMFSGKKRFKEFKEENPNLSNKVLSDRLKNLESNGIIEKRMVNSAHVSTEYYLTERGKALNRVIYELAVFALKGNFCPVSNALIFLSKKWSIELIRDMFFGKKRFKEFKEGNPNLSNKVLSDCLKNLENNGLIEKRIVNSTPVSTEYYLTKRGKALNRVIYELAVFALENCDDEDYVEESTRMQIKQNFKENLQIIN